MVNKASTNRDTMLILGINEFKYYSEIKTDTIDIEEKKFKFSMRKLTS